MRCLDNIATHSAVGLGGEQGVVAEADAGSVQPSGDRKALVAEGLRGTRRVHCCAAVQVHPMHTREPNQIARDPEPVTLLSRSRVARARTREPESPSPSPSPSPSLSPNSRPSWTPPQTLTNILPLGAPSAGGGPRVSGSLHHRSRR